MKITILLDVVHVIEYVWKATRALFGESNAEAEAWVGDRLLALLTGRSGGAIVKTIHGWASRRKLDESALKRIDTACNYLADRTRTRLLHYAEALRDGLPIATGVIEGACRYLVKDRMARTGARWSLTGAEAVLRLRAVRASGDFDAYGEFHLTREKERNHTSRYEGARIPDPLPAPKPRLRRVKGSMLHRIVPVEEVPHPIGLSTPRRSRRTRCSHSPSQKISSRSSRGPILS